MTAVQAILPQHFLSRLVGKLAQLEKPGVAEKFPDPHIYVALRH